MQVYKSFFRILNKQKGTVIMYLAIFMTISTLISSQGKDSAEAMFQASSCSFAVFDEDNSVMSRSIINYLSKDNEIKEIEDDPELIQDEVYERNLTCVIRIKKGFGEAVRDGKDAQMLEITAVPGTVYGELFENQANGYVRIFRSYTAGGFSETEAVEKTEGTLEKEVDVTLADSRSDGTHSKVYYYYQLLPYIYIAICIGAIGPILIVFRKKDVRDRIQSSPYPMGKMNLELYGGMVTTGLGLVALHSLILTALRLEIFSMRGLLFVMNEICFLVTALGITFLVGQLAVNQNIISMIANVVGLGFSFLGGVFVPLQLMGDGILRAAHFIPSYWYVRACEWIDGYVSGDSVTPVMGFMGIDLLFGIAFICAGLACLRMKRRA